MTEEKVTWATKMLDPEWISKYVASIRALNESAKDLSADGFKQLLELESQRISKESEARIKEIDEAHQVKMEELRVDHELRMTRIQANQKQWWRPDGFVLVALAGLALMGFIVWLAAK